MSKQAHRLVTWLLVMALVVVSLIAIRTLIVHFQADGTPDAPELGQR
jgi:hypothetical protein